MALTYPGRTFSGSKNPSEWFGVVNPAKQPWKPRAWDPAKEGITDEMWAAAKAQAPGDLGGVMDPEESAQQSAAWAASNDLKSNMATGAEVIKQRRAKMRADYYKPRAQVGGPDFGESYGMGYQNDGTPWGDYFQALVGKEENIKRAWNFQTVPSLLAA